MKDWPQKHQFVTEKVRGAFPDAVEEVVDFRGERTLIITKEKIKAVCQLLRDDEDLRYNMLEDVVADDLLPEFPRFAVSYHVYSIPNNHRIRLRVAVDDPDEGPESVHEVWPIASWLQMEVWDLMGISFTGNENKQRRLFLPEDWQGHPLRKDYPLGYEEVQFSFNYEEIDAKKPYAQD